MAGITFAPGEQEQLILVGWLRWRLFVNSLRSGRRKLDLVARIVTSVGLAGVVLLVGPLMGVGSWYATSHGRPGFLLLEVWIVLGVWLLLPILISGFGAESDPASLLRFPLRYSTFVLLALAHGIFDPVSLACMYWLAAMLAGIAFASPGALVWAAPALGVFAFLNLLLNRAIYAWLTRWLAQRRTREVLGALFILVALSMQFITPLTQRYGKRALPWVKPVAKVARYLPPGMAADAISNGHAGNEGGAGAALAGLAAYCAALGWLLALRLRAEYRGENLSEARRPAADQRSAVRGGWSMAGVSPTVAALFEKDLHYLLRNTTAYINLLAPVLIILVLSMSHGNPHGKGAGFMLTNVTFFPMGVAYVLLTVVGLTYNNLAYDGPGLPMLLAAPIRFREVMVAKNLLHTVILVLEVLAVFAVIQFVAGPTPPRVIGATLAGALWALLMNLAAGNLVSLYFPRKMRPGQMRRQQGSGLAMAASMGVQVVVAGLATGLYFLSRWAGSLAWCAVGFLGLAIVTGLGYRHVLGLVSGIAWKRREVLMAELSRPD